MYGRFVPFITMSGDGHGWIHQRSRPTVDLIPPCVCIEQETITPIDGSTYLPIPLLELEICFRIMTLSLGLFTMLLCTLTMLLSSVLYYTLDPVCISLSYYATADVQQIGQNRSLDTLQDLNAPYTDSSAMG